MKALALVLGLLAGCSSGAKEKPMDKSIPPTDGVDNRRTDPAPDVPEARSLADLQGLEGQAVRLRGTFRFPTEKAFARNKLELDDGTIVILSRPADAAVAAVLVEANQGARVTVGGVIYTGQIPDRYKIIGRTPDPYLVDVASAELTP